MIIFSHATKNQCFPLQNCWTGKIRFSFCTKSEVNSIHRIVLNKITIFVREFLEIVNSKSHRRRWVSHDGIYIWICDSSRFEASKFDEKLIRSNKRFEFELSQSFWAKKVRETKRFEFWAKSKPDEYAIKSHFSPLTALWAISRFAFPP